MFLLIFYRFRFCVIYTDRLFQASVKSGSTIGASTIGARSTGASTIGASTIGASTVGASTVGGLSGVTNIASIRNIFMPHKWCRTVILPESILFTVYGKCFTLIRLCNYYIQRTQLKFIQYMFKCCYMFLVLSVFLFTWAVCLN